MKTFGQRFRQARLDAKLTQDQIAEVCKNRAGEEISRAAVSNWEKDKDFPSLDNFIAALKRMGASADQILGLSAKQPISTNNLTDCIEIVEETLPTKRYKIPAKRRALIIKTLYDLVPSGGQLTTAEVLKFIRPIKSKYDG